MIKLLKKMGKREVLMAVLCALLVLGQVYFDLTLPDYMTDLTMMLNTAGSETSDILNVGLKMLGCTLASAALAIVCGYLSAKTASGFSYTIREKLFNHVMDMGSEEMQDFSIPSLITRTTNDITQIQMIVSMGLQMIIKSPIMAVWAVIKILGKSWELSAVTAAFVVVICVFVLAVMATCIPRFRIVQKLTDKINRVARENLTGINVVHAFNAEKYQNDKFDVPSKDMMNTQLKNQRMFALMMPVMNIGMNGLTLAIYWLGAVLIQQIALTAVQDRITFFSNVVVFSTYATYVVMSFMMLVMIFMMLPAAQVSAERINEVLERDVNIKEGSVSEGREQGTVEFKNVSFRYPHASEDELSNISFKIEKGQNLAIIVATGSGKTTLISLIPRFYDVRQGEVLVDGVDVKEYPFSQLRGMIGIVPQKAVLFKGTIRHNMQWRDKNATDEDIWNALDIAQAKDFVEKKPDKLDEMILQEGKNLSGGQRQRLTIARALVGDPEILILDDSASALDLATDARLRKAIHEKTSGMTVFIVSQRISSIKSADEIIVLDDGKIAGIGTHSELYNGCEVYKEICLSQLSEKEAQANG